MAYGGSSPEHFPIEAWIASGETGNERGIRRRNLMETDWRLPRKVDSVSTANGKGTYESILADRTFVGRVGPIVVIGRVFFRIAAIHDGVDVGNYFSVFAASAAAPVYALVSWITDIGGLFGHADGCACVYRSGGVGGGESGAGW